MSRQPKGARNWCFTLNNYTDEDINQIQTFGKNECKYIVFGKEIGENKTPHLQGYAEFPHTKLLSTLKKLHPRIHYEIRKCKNSLDASNYCKKGEQSHAEWNAQGIHGPNFGKNAEIFESGTLTQKRPGSRTDITTIKQMVNDAKGMRDIIEVCTPSTIKFAEKYLQYKERKRNWKPIVEWIYGPTGTGKSKYAHDIFADKDYYRKSTPNKWWDGYDAHEYVIIDDFRGNWWTLIEMLNILDRYAMPVECKGGSRQFLAKHIIITSALHPADCYKGIDKNERIDQLLRRIDKIVKLDNPTAITPPPINTSSSLRSDDVLISVGAKDCTTIVKTDDNQTIDARQQLIHQNAIQTTDNNGQQTVNVVFNNASVVTSEVDRGNTIPYQPFQNTDNDNILHDL